MVFHIVCYVITSARSSMFCIRAHRFVSLSLGARMQLLQKKPSLKMLYELQIEWNWPNSALRWGRASEKQWAEEKSGSAMKNPHDCTVPSNKYFVRDFLMQISWNPAKIWVCTSLSDNNNDNQQPQSKRQSIEIVHSIEIYWVPCQIFYLLPHIASELRITYIV